MKIVSLIENTTQRPDMLTEHGLSLYMETEHHKILFDMGLSDCFAQNAEALGIDLSQVDMAILSHGHHDHGGGLKKFLQINQQAPVYLHKEAFQPYYNATETYIGLDPELQDCPRLIFTEDSWQLDSGLLLISCNQLKRKYKFSHFGLTRLQGSEYIPDDFRHEQYLLIEEAGKKILISGCSHKGILNIVEWFSPDVLVGGFHFFKMELGKELADTAKLLNTKNVDFYTCHCTGTEQYAFIKKHIKRLNYLSSGETLIL